MPMSTWIPGDIEPCDECKKAGIAIAEVDDDNPKMLTGRRWLVNEDAVRRVMSNSPELLERVIKHRVCVMPHSAAEKCGLMECRGD